MDKIFSFALLALAGYKVISSFINQLEAGTFFGQEINIWLYRAIWLVVAILAASNLLRKMKKN
ncbi:hypothetical protein G5B37_07500 [Rasiella rasia]|uniref:Uncharacterized protein n=1 Tax=Rasiella rasia TaxID=2744027 RepID=A0A6G6GLL6_9FLAO|nr:hypothetical protein [Rasiella rasia]QIE59414.1 hypothetical protein G5B37_07500 [Rasiella rasia]